MLSTTCGISRSRNKKNKKSSETRCEWKVKNWNNLSASRREPTSKPEGHISQWLGYMRMIMHCLNRLYGHKYLTYTMVCRKSIKEENLCRPMFDDKLNCICDVCECDYSVLD